MTLWNLVQQMQIEDIRRSQVLAETSQDIRHSQHRNRADDLDADLGRLLLLLDAMWSLLSERLGVTVEDLRARIDARDLADGTRDGAYRPPPRRCPSCQAAVVADQQRCQFCGAEAPGADWFAR